MNIRVGVHFSVHQYGSAGMPVPAQLPVRPAHLTDRSEKQQAQKNHQDIQHRDRLTIDF